MKDLTLRSMNQRPRILSVEEYTRAGDGVLEFNNAGEVIYKACFAPGTLVHTDQGMLPIEEVRVGTRVWSQPEAGGMASYRPVVGTTATLDQEVLAIQIAVEGVDQLTTLIATPNHPFWIDIPLVHDEHWLAAECLEPGHVLQMADRRKGTVHAVGRVHRTQYPHVGFAGDDRVGAGIVLDLSGKQPKIADAQMLSALDKLEIKEPYLTPVYNFTVEEFHTYYVGEEGVWVHNTNCDGAEALSAAMLKSELEGTCFDGDTLVYTLGGNVHPDGTYSAPIEETEVGEYVLSRCELTGETAYKRVTRVFAHGFVKVCRLLCDYDAHLPGTSPELSSSILATAEHPFWVQGKGWVPVRDLQPGDEFVTYNGDRATLRMVELDAYHGEVFNLEVEDFHTYFVALKGVWVHNKNCGGEEAFSAVIKKSDLEAACFSGDTYVLEPNGGFSKMESLDVGTLLLSRCERTGEMAPKRILKIFERSVRTWEVHYHFGPKLAQIKGFSTGGITTTEEHPFWVEGKGWTPVRDLKPGDVLFTHDGEPATVSHVLTPEEYAKLIGRSDGCCSPYVVYNFEVEDFNTYFVDIAGIWVHNCNHTKPEEQGSGLAF